MSTVSVKITIVDKILLIIMKNIKLNELKKEALLTQKQPICIEHNGKLVGYYYPAIDDDKVKAAKEKLDTIMEKVLAETGLTEDEYISMFMNAQEESCV